MNALTTLKLTCLEQRHADFPQRDLDGLLREADLTAEGLEDVLKACAE
jgi:hypothetical protein